MLLDNSCDGVDVGLVVCQTIVGHRVLAVGSKSRTITVGKIVYDKGTHDWGTGTGLVECFDVGEVGVHGWDLGCGVTEVVSLYLQRPCPLYTYSQTNVPTLATALALAASVPDNDGMAEAEISDA